VSEDAGIETRTVTNLALAVRRSTVTSSHSAVDLNQKLSMVTDSKVVHKEPGLALKNPPKKTHPKKPKKTHLKKPTKKCFFFGFFWVFLNFLFFMKIIQTFLFQTDFL
jgi:hypothetical protein